MIFLMLLMKSSDTDHNYLIILLKELVTDKILVKFIQILNYDNILEDKKKLSHKLRFELLYIIG